MKLYSIVAIEVIVKVCIMGFYIVVLLIVVLLIVVVVIAGNVIVVIIVIVVIVVKLNCGTITKQMIKLKTIHLHWIIDLL